MEKQKQQIEKWNQDLLNIYFYEKSEENIP